MRKALKNITAVFLGAAQVVGMCTVPAFAAGAMYSTDTISAGDNHSLVIRSDKTLWAAGDNSYGQLGVNTGDDDWSLGVKVMNNVVFAEANDNVSFAIDVNGALYGWGDNTHGQISSRASDYITEPYKIMDNVVMVSSGASHTVALTKDGTAYGWGSNDYGELGKAPNSIENSVSEIQKNVADIAAGDDFTLLVTKDGALYACGDNNEGQLGLGNYGAKSAPTLVLQNGVAAVEAGDRHSIILKTDGTVWAAGRNEEGQIGNNSSSTATSFVSVGLSNVSAVFAGGYSSGALNSSGSVYTWGANASGQLHNGGNSNVGSPAAITSGVASIAFGDHHSIMLKTNGYISSAGSGAYGELFTQTANASLKPERILHNVISFSAGKDHAAAVDSEGRLYTWGNNDRGQLGLGDTSARNSPAKVTAVRDVYYEKVWCGDKITFAMTDDNNVYVFGDNSGNMFGTRHSVGYSTKPVLNEELSGYGDIEIYPSNGYCLALAGGVVYGWGKNGSSRLLDCGGSSKYPTEIYSGFTNITKLAVGANHCLALDSSGTVWVWGSNSSYQLGMDLDGYIVDTPTALEIKDRKDNITNSFKDIAACDGSSMFVDTDGKVWVAGSNNYGQLGTSSSRIKNPISVESGAEYVIAGSSACGVIRTSGDLEMSGKNTNGALGDTTIKDRSEFYETTASNVYSADIGDGFGCYVSYDEDLYCWGDNSFGQVGNGRGGTREEPEAIYKDGLLISIKQAEGISLDKTSVTIRPGHSVTLKATITPADAATQITWTSSNTAIATVTDKGVVRAAANGTATITAKTSNGLTAACNVTVTVPVTSFSVTPKKKDIVVGKSFTIKTKVYPSNAVDKTLLYTSSDPDILDVTPDGKVTAVSAGKANIVVTAQSNPDKTRTITVTVRPTKPVINYRKSTTDGVTLKWEDSEGADGYEVFRKVKGSSAKAKSIGDAGADNEFTDDTAMKGKSYIYSVKAYVEINGKKVYSAASKQYIIKGKVVD